MIRSRFKTKEKDYRPVNWPIKHPYWCTGFGENYNIIVAYADNEEEILHNWPEAYDIDSEDTDNYIFTDRFKQPEWFKQ